MDCLVSIITPSYNCENFVAETILSVMSQSYEVWEMIIVDDGSTDNSISIINEFVKKDPRIKLIINECNEGAAASRNKAIDYSAGKYIAFLDSDDLWLPDKLEKQLAFMKKNNYSFSYTAYDKIDKVGQVSGRIGVPDRVSYSDLLKMCSIGCLTAMYGTEYFGKVYMPLIRKRQDLGLWLRLLKKTDYAYGMNETLAQYRVRTDSISADKASAAKFTWRLYRDVEGLNILKASYYFFHYAVNGMLRTKFPKIARFVGVLK